MSIPTQKIGIGAAVIAALSLGGAWGTNQVVAGYLALPDGVEMPDAAAAVVADAESSSAGVSRKTSRRSNKRDYVDPIIARNMFDPDAINVVKKKGTPIDGQPTDLDIILLGTVVASPDTFSSALIAEDKRDGEAKGYGVDDPILNEGKIHKIEKKRVWIERTNGDLEYLAMDEDAKPKKRTPTTAKNDKEGDGRVEQTGENQWAVDRSLIDEQLANVEKLATQIRVVPHKDPSGNIDGYRLSGIRRNSLFDQLGIKNGDIVHGVNNMGLTSADGALKAYQSLQNDSSFSFDLTRRNQKQTFDYDIR
jgi:general secretion pathway protein C